MIRQSLSLVLFFFIIISNRAISATKVVENFEVLGLKQVLIEYKEICKQAGIAESLIIEAVDLEKLDCMGKIITVSDFCEKNGPKENARFVRSFIDKEKRKVVCQFGEGAILTVNCNKKELDYCAHEQEGCLRLGNIFAKNIPLEKSFMSENGKGEIVLSCHYFSKIEKIMYLPERPSL